VALGSLALLAIVGVSIGLCRQRSAVHSTQAAVTRDASGRTAAVPLAEARPDASGPASFVLSVPRADAPWKPTGEFNVGIWGKSPRTRTLLDDRGQGAVPVSEARFLWQGPNLYFFFYAGDLDLQCHAKRRDGPVWLDDSVAMTFISPNGVRRMIQISPAGVVADGQCPADASGLDDARCDLSWDSGVTFGVDSDGTFNRIGDFDEEWAVEAAVPFASIGIQNAGKGSVVRVYIRRCEIAHDGPRACGTWGDKRTGGELILQ
jgi:hypothetical protein